jgi:proton-translocating NADH-quinone oxidoreductase chain M
MGLSLLVSLFIVAKYGITKSKTAETIGLITSIISLLLFSYVLIYNNNIYLSHSGLNDAIYPFISNKPYYDKSPEFINLWHISQPFNNWELPNQRELSGLSGISFDTNVTGALNEKPQIKSSYFPTVTNLFDISISGLSLVFIGLTVIIMPIAILAAETKTEMISSLLTVEALLIGAFVTVDFFSFYILFEIILIPMFFLIGATGSGSSSIRSSAATRFFLYTLAGSVLMLLALIGLYLTKGTTNWYSLVLSNNLEYTNSNNLYTTSFYLNNRIQFIFIFIAFAVKVPMIPVHLWLPEAHTIAPTPGSMILASLLLKLGGYGILKWLIPIYPESFIYFQPFILILSIISSCYCCATALRQIDIKRIIAYSSIVHMNVCIFAIFSLSNLAIKASIFEMFSHGIISTALFYIIGCLYSRYKTRTLAYYRGMANFMPYMSTFFFIFILANSAVPLTSGFVGEFLMLAATISVKPMYCFIISLSMIANAAYNIWLYNRLCFGQPSSYISKYKDLTYKEFSILAILTSYTVILGVFPNSVLYFIDTFTM